MKIIRTLLFTGFLMSLILIQYLIWNGDGLSLQQKLVSSLFSWIIPCAWIMVIFSIVRTTEAKPATKEPFLFSRFTFALN
jgi:hypothetical protein